MARPPGDGVGYWNLDVDFFQNKKVRLLRGEFGIRGVYIYVLILNEVYRDKGYYKKWDYDDCCLMSDSPGVGGDCSPNLIAEIVQGCVRRSLFDRRVLDVFGVLTSAEIQRRFLKMVGRSRDTISIVQEYFLLDTSNRKDVAEATLGKLAFFSVTDAENGVSRAGNPINRAGNPQRKEKEKISTSEPAGAGPDGEDNFPSDGGERQTRQQQERQQQKQQPQQQLQLFPEQEQEQETGRKKRKAKSFDHQHKAYLLASYLDREVSNRFRYYKPKSEADLQKWAYTFDLMNRRDEIPWDTMNDVLAFSQYDDFWRCNIQSPDNFRKKFNTLWARMNQASQNGRWDSG